MGTLSLRATTKKRLSRLWEEHREEVSEGALLSGGWVKYLLPKEAQSERIVQLLGYPLQWKSGQNKLCAGDGLPLSQKGGFAPQRGYRWQLADMDNCLGKQESESGSMLWERINQERAGSGAVRPAYPLEQGRNIGTNCRWSHYPNG